ncbi:MAG: class F sortase [Egibacteraceae bacterium]
MLTIVGTVVAMAVWFATPSAPAEAPVAQPSADGRTDPAPQLPADPARVHVAARGITADTIALGKHADGSLEVPENAQTAGWWTGGAIPGAPGAAVIVGHVDSHDGPGAFFGLAGAAAGDRVTVQRADGSDVHFRVARVETHAKDAFPTTAVYGHTEAPTLRLVTCAGRFDPAARSYEDNVVVFADLEISEGSTQAPGHQPLGEAEGSVALPPPTPGPDGRSLPIGLATLGVIGTAAAVTRQALRVGA